MAKRLQLFPVIIVTALVVLGVKANDFVRKNDISFVSINVAVAQEKTPEKKEMSKDGKTGDEKKTTADGEKTADMKAGKDKKGKKDQKGKKGKKKGKEEEAEIVEQSITNLSKSEIALLEALSKRRIELDKRETELKLRHNLLIAAEKRIDKKIARLEEINKAIEINKVKQKEVQNGQFKNLVSIYEGMKPKEAARIFDGLDDAILLQMAERMSPRKMSAIMAKMKGDAAERLTIQLANKAIGASKAMNELPQIGDGKSG